MRHTWNPEDDATLHDIIMALSMDGALPDAVPFWPAVAGALCARGLPVTAKAASARYSRLCAAAEPTSPVPDAERACEDAWERVEKLAEQHEADALDWICDALHEIRSAQVNLGLEIAELKRMWT